MAKWKNLVYMYLLALTITKVISVSASSNPPFMGGEEDFGLSWSIKAAKEAEVVAAVPCSGHGRAFIDSLVLIDEGENNDNNNNYGPICECNACFSGPDCSIFEADCPADAKDGELNIFETFWRLYARNSSVLVSGWHRMRYNYSDESPISPLLVKRVRKLHEIVGNAVTHGRYIVFGSGSTQLINAAVYALSYKSPFLDPAKVVNTAPYYPLFRKQTEFFNSRYYTHEGDTSEWKGKTDNITSTFIEFVVSPNNPDGLLTEAVLKGPNVKTIHDLIYYWPHFTPIPSPADEDLMIFSNSKLTGHGGNRFGWAIVKDEDVYKKMDEYIQINTKGISREAQLRALKLLNVVLEGNARHFFQFGYATMRIRWARLKRVLSRSNRFTVQKLCPKKYCSFYKRFKYPTPAYAWMKCEREEDKNCYDTLKAAGISCHPGSYFTADDRFARVSISRSQDDFEILLNKLRYLIAKDGINHSI